VKASGTGGPSTIRRTNPRKLKKQNSPPIWKKPDRAIDGTKRTTPINKQPKHHHLAGEPSSAGKGVTNNDGKKQKKKTVAMERKQIRELVCKSPQEMHALAHVPIEKKTK